MKAVTMAYKPVGWALGAASGMAAGAIFGQAWKLVEGGDDAPDATDENRGWAEILLAAALQGAIFSVVPAVDRTGALVVRRLTA
jgi:predicted metal-dependent enzyme (double-stranded beta helix superfamily)